MLAAVASLALVSGCGGSTHDTKAEKPATKAASPVATAQAQPDSAAGIAKMLGCTTPLKATDSMAQEEQVCKVRGREVSIIRTPNMQVAQSYVDMGSGLGSNYASVSDHWLVAAQSRKLIVRAANRNGWAIY